LVFAPLPGTTDQIRGPVIIDGGVGINSEPFLNNPLMLPGETNLPLPDGTILGNRGTDTSGNGTVTDPNATNLNQTTGQRPGFDPRMNQFPYTIEFLSGADKGVTFDVGSVSQDILSIGNTTPFQVSVSTDGAYTFIGTPAQTMSVEAENGQGLETTSLNGLAGLMWTQASIALTGLPSVGDTWTITLDGHPYSYVVQNGDQVASLVAEQLAKLLANPPAGDNLPSWNVQVRVSLTGDATLIITCGAGSECTGGAFTAGFDEVAAKGTDAGAIATLTGTPQTIGTTSWTMAAVEVTSAGTRWSISAGGSVIASCGVTGAPSCGTSIAGTLQKLDQQVPSNYLPLISGTTVTLATGWSVGSQGAIVPAGGTEYVIEPLNENTRVDESTQVDTINFDDSNSPADQVGTVTEDSITGFGMGGDTVIANEQIPGGITYSNIEQVNVLLGSGDNDITLQSTGSGRTSVTTGDGNNTINVESTGGPTSITTGKGNDTVNVSTTQQLLQLGAALTIDTGAGNNTLKVD